MYGINSALIMEKLPFAILSASTLLMTNCTQADKENLPPNVVFILTDDQGWGDFGFNGNDQINTPVLDSLASESASFSNFYVSPLSSTTRAGVLTGRDHIKTGALFVTRASENMDDKEITIAEVLKGNGYNTGCFGKWHNGAHYPQDPNGQGFDEFYGFCAGHLTNYFNPILQHNQEQVNAKGYITDILTDKAISFIDSRLAEGKPYFCYIPYNAPHAPYQVPDEYYNKYIHLKKDSLDMIPAVYAMCENVDHNIGRIMAKLEESNSLDNTIVVFMTDNGPNDYRYNGGMRGKKGMTYEGGIKVPLLVYWKGHIQPAEIEPTASYIDVMPTILDLCGATLPETKDKRLDGLSLKNIISKDQNQDEDLIDNLSSRNLFTHRSYSDTDLNPYEGAVFNQRYKMLAFKDGRRELYDKENDYNETKDISTDNAELLNEMNQAYESWFAEASKQYQASVERQTKVGLIDSPVVLYAHEGQMNGRVRYFRNIHGWAGDWFADVAPGDDVFWDIEVLKDSEYEIFLEYTNRQSRPLEVVVSLSDSEKSHNVLMYPYTPEAVPSHDRVERVEAYEQTWNTISLGRMNLARGPHRVMLDFSSNKNIEKGDVEIKSVILKL